jgi:hypothetical protein
MEQDRAPPVLIHKPELARHQVDDHAIADDKDLTQSLLRTRSKQVSQTRSSSRMPRRQPQRADFHGEWNYTIAPSNQLHEAIVC